MSGVVFNETLNQREMAEMDAFHVFLHSGKEMYLWNGYKIN